MKCVGLLALLISIQWVSKFIDLHHRDVAVEESNPEFENNENVGDKSPSTEENDYVEEKDITATSEPENVGFHRTNDADRVDTSETMEMTQAYVADDVDTSSESIVQSTTDEPYFFKNLEDLLDRSSGVLGNISNSTITSVASIAASLEAISTTSFDMLPKVADQIALIYKGLSRVIGPDMFMLSVLINSLPSIFNDITSALKELERGIGVEASDGLKNFIVNVQVSLQSLLDLLNGTAEENANLFEIMQGIGKSVQYVASSVTSISLTISEAIDSVNKIVAEAATSLLLIFSGVLYVTQWVLSLGVSIFRTLVGSVSDILSKLTIVIANTIENVSRICSIISMIHSDSLENISVKIVPLIQDLKQLVTLSYTPISGNVVNIVFKIDKILTGTPKPNQKPIAELNPDTSGTIPEILNSLTGKLVSISPELSSAWFSLNNSLKISSNFGSSALNVISSILTLVLTRLTTVNGAASEILSLISDLLEETFNHLSNVVAKFSVLGDVSKTLYASVSNIKIALRTLIDSIIDFSTDLNLVDPIKNVAKQCQILISAFSAIFEAVSQANNDVSNKLSEVITYLPYILSTLVVVVQYVLGASIAKVLLTFGSVPTNLQELTLALSTILQRLTSITANVTLAQSGSDVNYNEIVSNILTPVSELNLLASTSLSTLSKVLANIKVSLDPQKNV